MDHRGILRREFDRIAKLTDTAYTLLLEGKPQAIAEYKDWASLLLRYHTALEQVEGKEGPTDRPGRSMKGIPDADTPPSSLATADDPRAPTGTTASGGEPETEPHGREAELQ